MFSPALLFLPVSEFLLSQLFHSILATCSLSCSSFSSVSLIVSNLHVFLPLRLSSLSVTFALSLLARLVPTFWHPRLAVLFPCCFPFCSSLPLSLLSVPAQSSVCPTLLSFLPILCKMPPFLPMLLVLIKGPLSLFCSCSSPWRAPPAYSKYLLFSPC